MPPTRSTTAEIPDGHCIPSFDGATGSAQHLAHWHCQAGPISAFEIAARLHQRSRTHTARGLAASGDTSDYVQSIIAAPVTESKNSSLSRKIMNLNWSPVRT